MSSCSSSYIDGTALPPSVSSEQASTPEVPAPDPAPPSPPMLPPPATSELTGLPKLSALRSVSSTSFDSYLVDASGRPLYMFVGDITGALESACLDACALEWPAFDAPLTEVSGLEPSDLSRFHRDDGAWQVAYKGHPLYYHRDEAGTNEVSADASGGRWFVARDYLVFLSIAHSFTPAGGSAGDDMFLTDGFGRTLYVCLDDRPRSATSDAVSSCDDDCLLTRPLFTVAQTSRTTLLPSVFDPSELRALDRADGQLQLTYCGWPLYYFAADLTPGSTAGHNERAWRAIDPISCALWTDH